MLSTNKATHPGGIQTHQQTHTHLKSDNTLISQPPLSVLIHNDLVWLLVQ
jgi:hypothetical protein